MTYTKAKEAFRVLTRSDTGKINQYACPNGFFFRDLLWFGEPSSTAVAVSRGFYINAPELSTMDESMLGYLSERLRQIIRTLGHEYSCQVKKTVGRDYRDVLARYKSSTDRIRDPQFEWQIWNRSERYQRYLEAMEAGKLRRERLAVFFTRVISAQPEFSISEKALAKHFEELADREAETFDRVHGNALSTYFPDCGITAMGDQEHFEYYFRFLNPSQETAFNIEVEPSFSIQDNCLRSCITQPGMPGVSFQLDGYNNVILVMQDLPRQIEAGMINRLITKEFVDYEITVNIYPQTTESVIKRLESATNNLEGEAATRHKQRHSLGSQAGMASEKINELERGRVDPVGALVVMRLWSTDYSTLMSRASIAKNAFSAMSGSVAYHATNATTARDLWYQTWPGWMHSPYRAWDIITDDQTGAELLPWDASFSGRLEEAEALYDSPSGGLVGITTQIRDTPQNVLVAGATGSGKSLMLADFLAQTLQKFSYCLIAEEGMSHGTSVQASGGTSLIISPGGDLTINYLDPQLPITPDHLAFCVALCMQMLGEDRKDQSRWSEVQSVVSEHINIAFDTAFDEWSSGNPQEAQRIESLALLTFKHQQEMADGSTFLDAWLDPAFSKEIPESLDPLEVATFATDFQTRHFVRDLAFAFMKPDQMPTHSELVEIMLYTPATPEAVKIGQRLKVWCKDGVYGKLFDGQTNVNLGATLVHFELSNIPSAREEMRSAAYFLIMNVMLQQIIKRPRAERKLLLFEEAARVVELPAGAAALKLWYTQARKYNATVLAAVQQYSAFACADASVKSAIIDNTKLFLISAQPSLAAVREIATTLGLTESVEKQIMMMPMVEHQTGPKKFSTWLMVAPDARRQLIGQFINIAAPELVYCAMSNTEVFDERAKALSQYDNVVDGILKETKKHFGS